MFARSADVFFPMRSLCAAIVGLTAFAGCGQLTKQVRINPPALPTAGEMVAASSPSREPSRSARGASQFEVPTIRGAAPSVDGSTDDVPSEDERPPVNRQRPDQFRLPARPGPETFFRPNLARGLASPASGDTSLFGADEGEGLASPPLLAGENSPTEDAPNFFDAEAEDSSAGEPHVISFRDDICGIPSMLWNDNLELYNWTNAIIIGAAAGGAVAIRDNLDKRVRQETAEEPLRWGQGSVVLRQFGEFAYQLPVLTGVYALSHWCEDDKLHEFSKAAFSAYGLSAMYTVAIKGITDTQRPTTEFQHGHYGFPSYHASSTFCLAAVIDEYYGWQVGVPAYVLAGLVGWSRIDQREHDLSDVVFGSILGFVIGKTVACAHLEHYSGFRVTPTYDPASGTTGVTVDTRF
jgi:hypothetical protein